MILGEHDVYCSDCCVFDSMLIPPVVSLPELTPGI